MRLFFPAMCYLAKKILRCVGASNQMNKLKKINKKFTRDILFSVKLEASVKLRNHPLSFSVWWRQEDRCGFHSVNSFIDFHGPPRWPVNLQAHKVAPVLSCTRLYARTPLDISFMARVRKLEKFLESSEENKNPNSVLWPLESCTITDPCQSSENGMAELFSNGFKRLTSGTSPRVPGEVIIS